MNKVFRQGIRHGIPIALGYLSVSFAFGMKAVGDGLTVLQAVLISMTNVTSAGQIAAVPLMVSGASLAEMALTQLTINLRYALMSLSLSRKLDGSMGTLQRMIFSFANTDEEAPDGEYVVLNFPKEETRFDFFKAEGKENYVRMVRYGDYEYETLYKGEYENDGVKASKVMQEWYDALIDAKASSVFAGRDGWMVRFDQKMIDAEETGKHSAKFTYKPGDADAKEAGTLEIRYVDGKQPQEVLGEVTEDWGDQEKIRRFEQTMPGTTDKWAFWRQMEAADSKDDTGRTAIAGEYNDGVLLFENLPGLLAADHV